MSLPPPVLVRSRRPFQLYLWATTLLFAATTLGLLLRALAWLPLLPEEPLLAAFLLPILLFAALTGWVGRWALFHATVQGRVDAEGLTMQSALARDTLRWEAVEGIRLQGTSGSEVQLWGNGHRVTLPSGSAAPPEATLALQEWLTVALGEREVEYGPSHFWGP